MNAVEVAAKIGQGDEKRNGEGWRMRCPAHADGTPSLDVSEGREGRVLVICRAGCELDSVLIASGLDWNDLFVEDSKDSVPDDEWSPAGRIMDKYDYVDEGGKLLFQVVRAEGKKFLQRRPDPISKSGWVWKLGEVRRPLYRLPEVIDAISHGLTVFVCYADDTEVLTRSGWKFFRDLTELEEVATWSLDGTCRWSVPSAHQSFLYEGDMVNMAADFSALLVTPDHRVVSRSAPQKNKIFAPSVRPASSMVGILGRQLPVAGILDTGSGITTDQARLVAAFAGDGGWSPRNGGAIFNIKKQRKIERLRRLLGAVGLMEQSRPGQGNRDKTVGWSEGTHLSAAGWTQFLVHGIEFVREYLEGPGGKTFSWQLLDWPLDARNAFLSEIGYWDGDCPGIEGVRFFTQPRQSADVVAGVASLSGWGAIVREDKHKESGSTFVVSLVPRPWRTVGNPATLVEGYSGTVYCLTVPSGFLVTRRDGKVTVSGNCEGEKDVDAIRRTGAVATCSPHGAGKWREEHTEALRDAAVVVVADRDEPGYKHARGVVKALTGVAAGVLLTQPAEGKDVFDHLLAGLTLDDLTVMTPEEAQPLMAQDVLDFIKGESAFDWVVDGLLERGDRLILTGFEGHGKSTLLRQMAICFAAGIHPFRHQPVPPVRALMIDCENGKRMTRRRFGGLVETAEKMGRPIGRDQLYIVSRPEGIDLTSFDDSEWLYEQVTAFKPDVTFIGPLYQLHFEDPNAEQPARVVAQVLRNITVRGNCALVTEAHAGKGEGGGGKRHVRPIGASLWMRWPEFGYGLDPTDKVGVVKFTGWRGPRDEREWPDRLERSSPWPWRGVYGATPKVVAPPAPPQRNTYESDHEQQAF